MAEYAVQAASFSEAIHIGRLTANGDTFADKQERTDMVLAAVGQYVERNFGGAMRVTFPGLGFDMEINLSAREPSSLPPERTETDE